MEMEGVCNVLLAALPVMGRNALPATLIQVSNYQAPAVVTLNSSPSLTVRNPAKAVLLYFPSALSAHGRRSLWCAFNARMPLITARNAQIPLHAQSVNPAFILKTVNAKLARDGSANVKAALMPTTAKNANRVLF
jgi:hypothetical protein